ncbi:MAG: hypothetical protein J0I29_12080, partial [Rhizobiales bacterium]|nr:hypothetical protein [Hyphomicrobiales bacterium]
MDPKPFGPGIYAARLLRATIFDVDNLLDEALEAGGQRRRGSGIAALDQYMRASPRRDFVYGAIFGTNMETIERLLRTCKELAEAIALAFDSGSLVRVAPFVLERALGEAIMRICYILDAGVPPARTILRMAAYQLESVEGNLRTAEAFGPSAAAAKARA